METMSSIHVPSISQGLIGGQSFCLKTNLKYIQWELNTKRFLGESNERPIVIVMDIRSRAKQPGRQNDETAEKRRTKQIEIYLNTFDRIFVRSQTLALLPKAKSRKCWQLANSNNTLRNVFLSIRIYLFVHAVIDNKAHATPFDLHAVRKWAAVRCI